MRSFRGLLTSTGLVTVAVVTLAACGIGSARECERALTAAATSVEGVVGAGFTCQRSFGNPSQKGSVTTAGTTETEVAAVMERVLQAFAASAGLDDASVVYVQFANTDGTISVHPVRAGFNGTPSIGELRDHYGITPG